MPVLDFEPEKNQSQAIKYHGPASNLRQIDQLVLLVKENIGKASTIGLIFC